MKARIPKWKQVTQLSDYAALTKLFIWVYGRCALLSGSWHNVYQHE